jgi:glycosyltransferase involved in cell wall biosynthesis
LIDRKGLDSLILAFKEVREHNDTLKIVGSGRNQKILQNRIWDLEMDSYIEMIDHLDFNSLMGVYAESQTLVLPSSKEVWGLVVNEALAAQLHVVVSRMSGVSEILESLDNAYVYGNGLQGLIEAMRLSRDNWRGWKDEPFILSHSTIEFAELLLSVSRKLD